MKKIFDSTPNTTYFISTDGSVSAATKTGKKYQKTATVHCRGYVYVRTTNGNYQVHRLVAKAFLLNPKKKPCVNHIDGNKQNNHLDNLEWVTYKENYRHAVKTGLLKPIGKNEGNVKYSNQHCKDVLNLIKKGMTYAKAGEKYHMPYSTVAHLVRGSRRNIT